MPPENLEPRVAALEEQVRDLRGRVRSSEHDAKAARVLAGGADRDVGELGNEMRDFRRATIASFNALRRDMVDGFRRVDERLEHIDGKFEQVDNGFIEMRSKLDITAAGQQKIVELIGQLIEAQGGRAPA